MRDERRRLAAAVRKVMARAKHGQFIVAVLYANGGRKTYRIKGGDLKTLGLRPKS